MPMATEDNRQGRAITGVREPVGPKKAGSPGTMGDQALRDALIMVLIAWAILFALAFTLRRHNI